MFLHAGAGLHGHEYSNKRHSAPAGNTAQRRNPLFRSSLAAPVKPSSPPSSPPPSEPSSPVSTCTRHTARSTSLDSTLALKPTAAPKSRLSLPPTTPEPDVRIQASRRRHTSFPVTSKEMMSRDDRAVSVSSGEVSAAPAPERRLSRRNRHSTTSYILARPPPKSTTKQRLMHIRPQLLLQTQQLIAGAHAKPTLDAFPSSAISMSALAAPLFKRMPNLAAGLGVRDILLTKSNAYDAIQPTNDEEESLKRRDLVAILSPRGQDSAEIVLADCSIWAAKVCTDTKRFAYEFTTQDHAGNTTTARWVRQRRDSKTYPASPSTPGRTPSISSVTAPNDFKFTFSIIDPSTRRHPVLATLTPTQLDVKDAYTDVTTTENTNPALDWQKNFIHVSAFWVALHQGWVANVKPMSFASNSAVTPTTTYAESIKSPTLHRFGILRRSTWPGNWERGIFGRFRKKGSN